MHFHAVYSIPFFRYAPRVGMGDSANRFRISSATRATSFGSAAGNLLFGRGDHFDPPCQNTRIEESKIQPPLFDKEQELLRPMQCSACCTGCYSRGWVSSAAHAPGQVKDAHCFSVLDILDDEAASHARRDNTGRRTSAHQREELQTHTHAFLHARYPRCTHVYKRYFVALF